MEVRNRFLSAVWCTRSRRVSDAKRSELLAKNLKQDLKDVTAAFVFAELLG